MSKIITDPIANFITKIRNASAAKQDMITDSYSKLKEAIGNTLVEKGFVQSVEKNDNKLIVRLVAGKNALSLKRVSKPGQRIYVSYQKIKRVKSGLGIGIYSTSKGILTDKTARKEKIGGEYICEVS